MTTNYYSDTHLVILILLLIFAKPIAVKVASDLPESVFPTAWTKIEVATAFLNAISALVILSAIPLLVNQFYGIIDAGRNMISEGLAEKERFNRLILGNIGAVLQIGIAVAVSFNAKRLAVLLDRWQR